MEKIKMSLATAQAVIAQVSGAKDNPNSGLVYLLAEKALCVPDQLAAAVEAADKSEQRVLNHPLNMAKEMAILGVVQQANRFTASVLDKYPAAEKAGWPQKQAECTAIIVADDGGNSIATALGKTSIMKAIAAAAGWDDAAVVATARAVITKAGEFAAIAAMVEVMREQAGVAIAAAADIEALELAKTDLMQQASALAVQYGLT